METTVNLVKMKEAEADGLSLKYYLYESELENRRSFSIECRLGEERVYLPDITSVPERAEEIFGLFVHGKVTPTSAFDVIEEILS